MWKSPNGTIRNILGGVVFREPIICRNVPRLVPGWTKPIIIGRHAFGDQYRATDFKFPGQGTLTIKFTGNDGKVIEREVYKSPGAGVAMAMYNLDDSIADFARASFNQALPRVIRSISRPRTPSSRPMTAASRISSRRSSTRNSSQIRREEDHLRTSPDRRHGRRGDEVVGRLRLGLQEYDGDVQSDTIAQGYGSLGLMTSVLMTPTARRSKPRPPTARSRGITASIRRARRPSTTRSPRSSPGPAGWRIAPSSTTTRRWRSSPQRGEGLRRYRRSRLQ
jgi:isocitrate dehydrogenase